MNTPAQRLQPPSREQQRVVDAFVVLADSLTDDFDIVDFLHQLTGYCVDLLDTDGAGVMIADPDGRVRLLASSDETTRLLELFEIDGNEGPCLSAYHSGDIVEQAYLGSPDPRWPQFAARAHTDGFNATHAVPMQLRGNTIGVLNLFSRTPGTLSASRQHLGKAFADVATIALLQHRAVNAHRTLADQLQDAFTTRLDIEQAKGLIAERHQITPEEAFQRIREHARRTRRKLADLARDLNTGSAALPNPGPPPTTRTRQRRHDGPEPASER